MDGPRKTTYSRGAMEAKTTTDQASEKPAETEVKKEIPSADLANEPVTKCRKAEAVATENFLIPETDNKPVKPATLQYLEEKGVDINNLDGKEARDQLFDAVRNSNCKMVSCFIEAGASLDINTRAGFNPLHVAAMGADELLDL